MLRLILPLLFVFTAQAENKLDGNTDGLVIDRLERALEDVDATSRTEVMLRLADLYAERARISEMNKTAKDVKEESPVKECDTCQAAKKDRKRAIELYSELFEKGKTDDKGRLLMQVAHLSQLNGDENSAERQFLKILKKPKAFTPDLVSESHSGLAEILYRRNKFKEAKPHFEEALKSKSINKKGQLLYRLAWCQLNLGNLKLATQNLEIILKDPKLSSYKIGDTIKVDGTFQEEVSRDYATFLARGDVSEKDITNLINLSPERVKTENVFHLANELDRLGKKKTSLMAWQIANARQTDPNEKLEGFVKMAQVQYDIGNKALAAGEVEKAVQFWKSNGCKKEDHCEELQHKLRKLIIDWDRASKGPASGDLFKAYQAYVSQFGDDTEIAFWAGNLGKRLGHHEDAATLFRQSNSLAKSDLKKSKGDEERKKYQNIIEASLLGEIESAELSKNPELRLSAYKNYLNQNSNGEKSGEVRYQIVHLQYEKGDYKNSAEGFRDLVKDHKFPHQLKPQTADLALDSLNIAKDERLEKWAIEFSDLVPERKQEYLAISRKATLNKVAKNLTSSDVSENDLRQNLNRMNAVPLSGMTKDQKVNYLKDKIVIARKLRDIDEVRRSSNELSKITEFKSNDNVFARQQLLWVSESTLDFAAAYRIAKVTDIPGKSDVEMQLQLGIYADLAGHNPRKHYENYIHETSNRASARQVMVSLIKKSKNPSRTFQQYESELMRDPTLYAPLALEDFGRNKNLSLAQARLSRPGLRSTPEAFVVQRYVALKDFQSSSKVLMFHRLKSSESRMKQSLTERLQLIRNAEKRASLTRDWTLQLVHLSYLANEYSRLYREIMGLPLPRGLNGKQKEEYKKLIRQQAEPYQQKAMSLDIKTTELWAQNDMRSNLLRDLSKTRGPLRNLMVHEVQILSRIAPSKYQSELRRALSSQPEGVDRNQIQKALQNVKKDPFDAGSLEHLKELEKKAGRHAMVAFLEAKVDQLKKGERQ